MEFDSAGIPVKITGGDWELLAKRLIGAMQRGIRIEQDSGHRYIISDGNSDFAPECLKGLRSKQYGSYRSVLDAIDEELVKHNLDSLAHVFRGINHYDNLGVVFGEGVQ